MKQLQFIIAFCFLCTALFAQDGSKDQAIVYLIGDTGAPNLEGEDALLSTLKNHLKTVKADDKALIFLGDNIYHAGMHGRHHHERGNDEAKINAQLDAVKDFNGTIAFIPGNHDWNEGKKEGAAYLKRQEEYIEGILGPDGFIPDDGCPGPVHVNLSNEVSIIIIDTQWWLQKKGRPYGVDSPCKVKSEAQFVKQLSSTLKDVGAGKQIIVVGHHPMYSNGSHGGHFTWKDHVFPLTMVYPKLYIPLPVIGSILPLYRKWIGSRQDIPHKKYQALINALESNFKNHENLIYASGHEHNLQYTKKLGFHHIVSGAGSKTNALKLDENILFGKAINGFARVVLSKEGMITIEYYGIDENVKTGKLLFAKDLHRLN